MRNQKRKRPNAQKHGVFSVSLIIPGEDSREFEESHSALIEEWQPSGPTQEEAVFALADLMWRKLRLRRFTQAKLAINARDPRNPSFDERDGLLLFTFFMRLEPETAFEKYASLLRADKINYLKQKFPRSNYKSTLEWAKAVIKDIEASLPPSLEPPEPGKPVDQGIEAMRKTAIELQLFGSIIYANSFLEYDLDQTERLDEMIARKVKYLMQLKAMKQMLFQTSPDREGE